MRPDPSLPATTEARRHAVDAALEAYLDGALPRLVRIDGRLQPVADELRAFLAGGKRLRPLLLLLGHDAAGGDPGDVMGPALALELLHACALLHDDIIDDADTRRGRPAVHVTFADQHRSRGWHGDADSYGRAVAILTGDLAFTQADELFLDAIVTPGALVAGLRRFTLLREEVMAGQFLDVTVAATGEIDRDTALRVATMKSGRYSVTRPLQIGAELAGADPVLVAGLEQVGDPLGRAFQLRDDLLGVFGEDDTTGKSATGDLAEGKQTLLIAETAARLDNPGAFLGRLGTPDLTSDDADWLREQIETSGARAAVQGRLEEEIDRALAQLEALPIRPAVSEELAGLAHYLGARTA